MEFHTSFELVTMLDTHANVISSDENISRTPVKAKILKNMMLIIINEHYIDVIQIWILINTFFPHSFQKLVHMNSNAKDFCCSVVLIIHHETAIFSLQCHTLLLYYSY